MLKKIIMPVINCNMVTGTKVQYLLFGFVIYEKLLITPKTYGIKEYEYHIKF